MQTAKKLAREKCVFMEIFFDKLINEINFNESLNGK